MLSVAKHDIYSCFHVMLSVAKHPWHESLVDSRGVIVMDSPEGREAIPLGDAFGIHPVLKATVDDSLRVYDP